MKRSLGTKGAFTLRLLAMLLTFISIFGFAVMGFAVEFRTGDTLYDYTDNNAVHGGTFRDHLATIRSLDPHTETAAATTSFTNMTYNGLLRLRQDMLDIEPDLTKSWRQIDDYTYEFQIHKGVYFHDIPPVNGRELTSADVKYSIERISGLHGKKAKFPQRFYFEDKLEYIKTPDKYTIIFKTNKPYASFIRFLASSWSKIVPREAVEEWGDLKTKTCGSGPFMLAEYVKGSHYAVRKHPRFFKEGLPYLDGIKRKIMPKPSTHLAAFLAGKLDATYPYHFQIPTLEKEAPDCKYYKAPGCYTRIVRTPPWIEGRQPLKPPFDSKKVRQAIAYAIDKVRLLQLYNKGDGQVQIGCVPLPYKPWGLPQKDQWEYNPKKAKQLLIDAGYPDGFTCELMTWNLPYMTGPAQIIQQMLKQVGIQIAINALDFSQYFNKTYRYKYEMAFHITSAGYDPEEWIAPYFGRLDKATYYKWSNHELWDMIDRQAHIMDRQKRLALIHEIQRKVMDEAMSQSMFTTNRHYVYRPYVHVKWYFHPCSGYAGCAYAWMGKH